MAAVTTVASGTQLAVIGTVHSLSTRTAANVYVFFVDTQNMVNGDAIILTISVQTISGGAEKLLYEAMYAHKQQDPVKISIPVPSDFSVSFKLQQVEGTGRNFDWAVKSLQ